MTKRSRSEIVQVGRIKSLMFSFLETKDRAGTLIYFVVNEIPFDWIVQATDIPAQNVPRSMSIIHKNEV